MAGTEGCQGASGSQSRKARRSPDCSLQLDCMKSESLVIADQHVAVNTFPGLVHTARHTMGVGSPRSRTPHATRAAAQREWVPPEAGRLTARRAPNPVRFMTGVKS